MPYSSISNTECFYNYTTSLGYIGHLGSIQISYHSIFYFRAASPLTFSLNYPFKVMKSTPKFTISLHFVSKQFYEFYCIFSIFFTKILNILSDITIRRTPPPPISLNYHPRSQPPPVGE